MKINPKIAALAKLTATENNRFVPSAVLYDGKTAVATDGHQLTVVTDRSDVETSTPMLLSIEALDLLKKLPPKQKRYEIPHVIEIQPGESSHTITVLDQDGAMKAQSAVAYVNGNFPDHELHRVKPENTPIHYVFDAKLLIKVLQGIIELDKDGPKTVPVTLEFGDCKKPMGIRFQNSSFDIEASIMPMRSPDGEGEISQRITEAAKQIRAEIESKPEVQAESEAA